LIPSSKNSLTWQKFDYENIDITYDKSFDELLLYRNLDNCFFLLFKKNRFIDYRYEYGDRESLNDFLKEEGEYETFD
jgi:hypothetical protein